MSETVFAFNDQITPSPAVTAWVTGSAFYPSYWQTISQGLPINDFITDGGGTVIVNPLVYNEFGFFSTSFDPASDTFTLSITCRGFGNSGNAIKIRLFNIGGMDTDGAPIGPFTEVEVVSGNSPVGDFGVFWGTSTWITFSRTFPVNALMFSDISFLIHIESEDALNTTFEIANISLTASGGLEITGDGGIEVNSAYISPDIIGDGGVEMAGAAVLVLSADASGIYEFIVGQHFDRIYTRNVAPDDTADIAMPPQFGKSGFFTG
jgi:hypothetical protein